MGTKLTNAREIIRLAYYAYGVIFIGNSKENPKTIKRRQYQLEDRLHDVKEK